MLTYDPTGEGERNPERRSGTRAHDKLERIEKLGRRQAGQMITDVMQAISYLVQRPEVDPERIAAMGYSMGSFVLAITGAVRRTHEGLRFSGGRQSRRAGGILGQPQLETDVPGLSVSFAPVSG